MGMSLVRYAAPTVEPVTVAECRARARIDAGNTEPAPSAITVALAGAGVGNVNNGAHRYACTFVTADGETEGGTVSSAVTVADNTANGQVALSAIPLGGAAVTTRKLYRTAAAGTTYLLLATLSDNTTTAYTDNTADSGLGAGMPTTNTTADPEINLFIRSARMMAEKMTRRALCTQTWELRLDDFPGVMRSQLGNTTYPTGAMQVLAGCSEQFDIRLPRPPLVSVTHIKYVDPAGVLQTLDPSAYDVDNSSEPARIRPVYGTYWPYVRRQMGAVQVRYVAGYGGSSAIPADIKDWLLLRAVTAWRNRAQFVVDTRITMVELPEEFADGLLDDYVVYVRDFE